MQNCVYATDHPNRRKTAASVLFTFLGVFREDPSAMLVLVSAESEESEEPPSDLITALLDHVREDGRIQKMKICGVPVTIAPGAALLAAFREAQPEMFTFFVDAIAGRAPLDPKELARWAQLDFARDVLARTPELVQCVGVVDRTSHVTTSPTCHDHLTPV